jgi:tripartite-type tricarboxylate transporter receptor subunit TctC
VVNPSLPAHNIQDLIALCKAKPGEINYGSSGVGGSLHLAMELFKSRSGIDIVHVAYKGGPPAATDLIAGQIGLMFFNTPAALPFVRAGKLRALGVSTAKRSALLPDVPSIAEAGVPGFDTEVWYGLVAPAGTSGAVVQSTYKAVAASLASPDVRRTLQDLGAEPGGISPEEFAQRLKSETRLWANVIRTANIHLN